MPNQSVSTKLWNRTTMSTTYKHVTMQSINAIYLLFLRSAAAARITGPNKTPPALITKHNKEGTAGRPPTSFGKFTADEECKESTEQ